MGSLEFLLCLLIESYSNKQQKLNRWSLFAIMIDFANICGSIVVTLVECLRPIKEYKVGHGVGRVPRVC